jgi:hypothetical protein
MAGWRPPAAAGRAARSVGITALLELSIFARRALRQGDP